MNSSMMNRAALPLMAFALLLVLTACANPRRITTGETTDAELRDPRQLPVTMTEFQEAAANDLLQRLSTMPELSTTNGPVTILIGDINNKTSMVPTSDYEYVVSGVRSRLINAAATRQKLRFVEKRFRVENLAAQERVASDPAPPAADAEAIKWGGGQFYVPDYRADSTYGLFMNVYQINRGPTNLYRMEMSLVLIGNNRIVYSYASEVKQTTR